MSIHQFLNWLPTVLQGFGMTALGSSISICTAIVWGSLIAIFIAMDNRALTAILRVYISIFRNSPLLVQIFFAYYALPYIGIVWPAFVCGVVCITLNEGAFIAEMLRGAMKNIPKGEIEAAYSLGLNRWQVVTRVIFPMTFRTTIPSITGQASIIIKDTSLFSMIMIVDLTRASTIFYAKFFNPASFYVVGLFYLAIFVVFSFAGKRIEKRFAVKR